MKPESIAADHFRNGRVMQIATLHDGQPRVNSVYYVAADDNRAVYWMSETRRRHSKDIGSDARIGGAVAVKTDQPAAGLQFTGIANEVTDPDEVKAVAGKYNQKYDGVANDFYERFMAGTNVHHVYKIVITDLELFDEVNFPGGEVISVPLG